MAAGGVRPRLLLGSIPFGLILTKLAGTQDLRSLGSGNIGATNVLRTGHKGLAAATLLLDMLKGTLAVVIAGYYGGPNAAMLAALGAFLGTSSGVAEIQGRQRRRGLYRRADRPVLAGRGDILPFVARDAVTSRYSSLSALVASFVTPIFLWWFGHPALASLFRRADAIVVLHAPRKHQAVAGRDRGADRGEVRASAVIPGRCKASNPESRDSGPGANAPSRNDGIHSSPLQRLFDEARGLKRPGVVAKSRDHLPPRPAGRRRR